MLVTRDDEFHVMVPRRLDTGFSRLLCDGDCDVDLDIEGVPEAIARGDICDLVDEGPWSAREQRGSHLVITKAKAYKGTKGTIDRKLTLDFYKIQENGSRAAKKDNSETYVNGRRVR